jgi:hypothetical protein
MTKSTMIKEHLTRAIEKYGYQLDRHSSTLKVINANYAGDMLRDELKKANEEHALALSSISSSLGFASDEVKAIAHKAHRKLSEPVSAEALRALELLKMRKDVSAREIESFVNRYGDNSGALSVIREIADKNGVSIETALKEKSNGSDGLTASGILVALDDLQTHVKGLQAGIDSDKGLLAVAVTHNLAGQTIDALGGHLDALNSYTG